ncbi:MAG: hypothetical protein ABIP94_03100 [Planctomycetota bacterium]
MQPRADIAEAQHRAGEGEPARDTKADGRSMCTTQLPTETCDGAPKWTANTTGAFGNAAARLNCGVVPTTGKVAASTAGVPVAQPVPTTCVPASGRVAR